MVFLVFLYKVGRGEERRARRAPRSTAKTKPGAEVGGQSFFGNWPRHQVRARFRRRAAGARDTALELAARRRAEVLGLERRRQADAPQAVDDVLGVQQSLAAGKTLGMWSCQAALHCRRAVS